MGGWIAASAHRAGGEQPHDPRPPKRAHAACGGMQGGCARDVPRDVGRRVDVRGCRVGVRGLIKSLALAGGAYQRRITRGAISKGGYSVGA